MGLLSDSRLAYKALNGLICVYKPSGVPIKQVKHIVLTNLCNALNALPGRPQEKRVEIVGATNAPLTVDVLPNYADDPLVTGPRYQNQDFRCSYATHLGLFTTGVLLIGLNEGTKLTYKVNVARNTRAYKITGRLGKATDTYFAHGKVVELATYKHVTREKIDRITAHMQAAHQKKMFDISGVHIESETAYELAKQGVIRPASNKIPVVYGIKCVYFQPPYFTLEVQSINEYENYLCALIHELGIQLKTVAHCTSVQCIRQGMFDVRLALLRKHWQLPFILDNMEQCSQILCENERIIQPKSALLQ